MSRIYNDWERLVDAALKKEQLRQLFRAQSRSPSISSDSSGFCLGLDLGSSTDESGPVSDQNGDDGRGVKTYAANPILIKDQPPVKNVTPATAARKRDLRIPVKQPLDQHWHYGVVFNARTASPVHFSRVHPRAVEGTTGSDPHTNWSDDAKQQSHPLPSPERAQSHKSPWKRGELLSKRAVGNVYLGFNSEKGKMCAVKEFILYSDGAKLEQSARCLRKVSFWDYKRSKSQFELEIALLSSLKHPNIVPYYGSEVVGDNLYCFYEYISGGSLYMILQQYGKLGESDIRSYTQQILSGLAYLHSKSIPHRDIRGANILVDPNGVVKLSNIGLEKQIAAQIRPLVLIDSSYWMAPEVICNPNSHNNAIDIWSLGCTVIEMATSKPPFSQYDWIEALFKIAHDREVPTIPDQLSDAGKDFLRRCLQWDPLRRATASQLLEHPFVKAKQIGVSTHPDHPLVSSPLVNPETIMNAAASDNDSQSTRDVGVNQQLTLADRIFRQLVGAKPIC